MQRTNLPVVPVQLDSSIAIKISMGGSMFQERTLMGRSDVWHKVKILKGTQYDKETVLKAILSAIEPAEMIPVKYQASGEDTYFLARNCAHALDKLCKTNLIIKNPEGDPLILIVTLGFASTHDLKLNLQPLLLTALTKKYNPNFKSLDLTEFHKDPDLSKTVYCPLFQQRTFCHVLKLTKTAIATVEYLNLQKNELFNLVPLEISTKTTIKYLDLRHNNLISMKALSPIKNLCITKLWLDGNPLCENYSNSRQYIDSALKYCPIQLDGVYIRTFGLPLTYVTYFKNESREELVRNVAHKRGLAQFTASNFNLLKSGDMNKKRQHIYYGQDNIVVGLKKLPNSYHEKSSFMWDLMYDDGKCLDHLCNENARTNIDEFPDSQRDPQWTVIQRKTRFRAGGCESVKKDSEMAAGRGGAGRLLTEVECVPAYA
ncbi:Nuclear RNA export factor 1 [Melipona quadrifasciata]|uniref:Nuclear RNA export factor 1 n=1 Tax=Melipona quadrifasciata TaxID=166423 RepID=A0A0M9A910_9HYME|nr:Nuclear RNA export factor 1 [Melipona quadrifasciata]